MTEAEWVASVVEDLNSLISARDKNLEVVSGCRLPYVHEVREYKGDEINVSHAMEYETDILVSEWTGEETWKPRVVIEAKINSVTTHDVITYSQKADAHRQVHPYLRYGIFLGNRKDYPLPGRLFRHGSAFDFMLSWQEFEPTADEQAMLVRLVMQEVEASRQLERMIFETRSRERDKIVLVHRRLDIIARTEGSQ